MSDFGRFAAYLEFMGIKLDASSFDSRVRMQKLAYLLSVLSGKPFTDDFSLYIRGPYSTELADYYYGNKKRGRSMPEKSAIEEKFRKELERVDFVKELPTTQLEIMATLHRLEELGFDEERAIGRIQVLKPSFGLDEIIRGLNNLKRFMLTDEDRKRILKLMEGEFKLWDNVVADGLAIEKDL